MAMPGAGPPTDVGGLDAAQQGAIETVIGAGIGKEVGHILGWQPDELAKLGLDPRSLA